MIHPSQVKLAHECFAPSEKRVKWAEELIKAFEDHKLAGKVIFNTWMAAQLFF